MNMGQTTKYWGKSSSYQTDRAIGVKAPAQFLRNLVFVDVTLGYKYFLNVLAVTLMLIANRIANGSTMITGCRLTGSAK